MMSDTKENFQYYLTKKVVKILAKIPRRQLVRLAFPLGKIWYGIDRYHRRIAYENMSIAFGQALKPVELKQMVRSNFVQLVRVVIEIPSLLKMSKKNVDSYAEFSGVAHLNAALARGKGVLFLTAHLGNWELMALAFSLKYDLPANVIARRLDSPSLDMLLTEIRSRTGNRVIDKDKSAGLISRMMQENKVVGILLDQNASWYEGVYVPFFGKTVCTNKGLAMFAMRYDATVLPAFNVRRKDGRYRVMFASPLQLIRTGDISNDIIENTAMFNTIIEKYIRMSPDNWLWVHRRWRMKDIPERARKKIKGLSI